MSKEKTEEELEREAIQIEGMTVEELKASGLIAKGMPKAKAGMPRSEAVSASKPVSGVGVGVSLPSQSANNTGAFRVTKVTVTRTIKTADYENIVVSMDAEISSDSLSEVKAIGDRLAIYVTDTAMAQKVRILLSTSKDEMQREKYRNWLAKYSEREI